MHSWRQISCRLHRLFHAHQPVLLTLPAAGQVTIGGSVARGAGSTHPERAFPAMFFSFLNASFPHP